MKLRHQPLFYLFLGLFFLSGFSALLYQVVWQRMLGCFAGIDVYSVTITVAAFMGGLGCGSLAGGQIADRVSLGARILIFCAAETAIALFALASKWLYYDLLYLRWGWLGNSPILLPVVLFLTLLVPTFCMGVTLPVLSKSFVDRIEAAPPVVGYLYGCNTLGAAAGAFCTTWILFRRFGFENILQLGAILNGVAAIGAWLVWSRLRTRKVTLADEARTEAARAEPARFSMAVWLLIYALSGFVALGLEIVWFRFFGVLQKSTAFTFGNLLSVYLIGLALGIVFGVPLAQRTQSPARAFLAAQAAVSLYAAGALALFIWKLDRTALLTPLWSYLQQYEPVSPAELFDGSTALEPRRQWQLFGVLYLALPAVLIMPATLLMGASFPLLQRAVQVSPALVGRRVGWLQTTNIAGSMLGAVIVGWASLRWFGTAGTLRMLALAGGVFAFLLAWQSLATRRGRLLASTAAAALLALVVWATPRQATLWAKLHGAYPRSVIFDENDTGLSVLKEGLDAPSERTWVYSNGLGQSWLPFGSVHTQLGLFGAILHPAPTSIAVIGLASGDTLYAAGGSPATKQLSCIELVRPQHATLSVLAQRKAYPPLDSLLRDARVQWLFTDGRAYVQRSPQRFDVIEADALRPNSAYSGNLYSQEYFAMIKGRLNRGGLAVSWMPTKRTRATFLRVFPYAVVVSDIAIGSEQPIEISGAMIAERLRDPFTSAHYAKLGDIEPLVSALFTGPYDAYLPDTPRPGDVALNSDLFPRDEFGIAER